MQKRKDRSEERLIEPEKGKRVKHHLKTAKYHPFSEEIQKQRQGEKKWRQDKLLLCETVEERYARRQTRVSCVHLLSSGGARVLTLPARTFPGGGVVASLLPPASAAAGPLLFAAITNSGASTERAFFTITAALPWRHHGRNSLAPGLSTATAAAPACSATASLRAAVTMLTCAMGSVRRWWCRQPRARESRTATARRRSSTRQEMEIESGQAIKRPECVL